MKTVMGIVALAILATIHGCANEGSFAGESEPPQFNKSQPFEREDDRGIDTDIDGPYGSGEAVAGPDDLKSGNIELGIPDNAVTKGSFTAWAEPQNPLPGQSYWIHIKVELPGDVGSYLQSDLSGRVIGTDGYQRGIGRDSKGVLGSLGGLGGLPGGGLPPWESAQLEAIKDRFTHSGTSARLSVWVPGAQRLVQDTIKVSSDLLNESQSLVIIFNY